MDIIESTKKLPLWKPVIRLCSNIYFLFLLALLPLVLISPITDFLNTGCSPKNRCEAVLGEPLDSSFETATGEKIVLKRLSSDKFYYPLFAIMGGYQSEVEATLDIDSNGNPKNVRVLAATSNLKKSFEKAAKKYLESSRYGLPSIDSKLEFPMEGLKISVPFKMRQLDEDGNPHEVFRDVEPSRIAYSVIAFLLMSLLVTGFRYGALMQWLSDTSISFGALLGLLYLNDAIYAGITTNFSSLAEALLMFCSFGAIAAISSFYANDRKHNYNLGPFKLFVMVFLIFELHFGIQEDLGLSLFISALTPEFYLEQIPFYLENPNWIFLDKSHIWDNGVMANINGFSLVIFLLGLVLAILHYLKKGDLSVFIFGALFSGGLTIAVTMYLWFSNFSSIQEDYVNLLDIAHIGSTGLTYLALIFLVIHLMSIYKNHIALSTWRRMNLYLVESMTFFLFFVYAPVSLSELGISYDEDQESDKNIERLESEIKELKEILKQNNLKLTPTES